MTWLDEDFTRSEDRDYFLKECLATKKIIPVGSVLQVSQCVNISVPRKNKEVDDTPNAKNSVLKITFTDGKSSVHALLTEYHPKITSSTVPGTKVEITADAPIVMNFVILTSKNVRVLGGVVPALKDQWEMQLAVEKMKGWGFRSNTLTNDGPPPWKPFSLRGGRIDRTELRGVKAMDLVKEQQKESGKGDDANKTKFDAQRQETISELAKKTQAKSFGEGKKLMDKGVLDIMNEGFSQEQAEEAMQRFKNPQKALKHLKGGSRETKSTSVEKEITRGSKKGSRKDRDEDENGPTGNEHGEQPSSSISLFGFIQEKIKSGDESNSKMLDSIKAPDYRNGGNSADYASQESQRKPRGDSRHQGQYDEGYANSRSDSTRTYQNQRSEFRGQFQDQDNSRGYRGGRGRGGGQRGDRRGRDYGNQYDTVPPRLNPTRRPEPRFSHSDRSAPNRADYGRSSDHERVSQQQPPKSSDFPVGFVDQPNHFPSLNSDYPPVSAPPPRGYQQQQHQHRGYDNVNFTRNGNDRQPNRHQDGQQTFPGRNRGYEGYERSARRNDGWNSGGHRMQGQYSQDYGPYNHLAQQFSNVSMQPENVRQFSGDWRPSHTMVFTRSRNPGRSGGGSD